MIKFEDAEILDILPGSLTDDPEVKALSAASKALNQLLCRNIVRLYVYGNLDICQENVIDYLAKELHTQYYDDTLPVETKRELIKKTLDWHIVAGSPAAVEQLMQIITGTGEVVENWDFDHGETGPYLFDINSSARFTEDTFKQISKMIRNVKNVRSHLRNITTERDIDVGANALTGANETSHTDILDSPNYEEDVSRGLAVLTGVESLPVLNIYDALTADRGNDLDLNVPSAAESIPVATVECLNN